MKFTEATKFHRKSGGEPRPDRECRCKKNQDRLSPTILWEFFTKTIGADGFLGFAGRGDFFPPADHRLAPAFPRLTRLESQRYHR
jgi:hypothetical protein